MRKLRLPQPYAHPKAGSCTLRGRRSAWGFAIACALACGAGLASAQDRVANASITIDAARVEGAISPMLYGQFDEFMFEGVKGGLSAELIRNRGFDGEANVIGLPRYWERDPDDRNDDPALHFTLDSNTYYPQDAGPATRVPNHALLVNVDADDGQRRGVHQFGIPVEREKAYRGYLWLKSESFAGRIVVALEAVPTGGEKYAAAEIAAVSPGGWNKYEFSMTSTKSDPSAKFSLQFYGRGRLWIDQISLMPEDAVDGVRRDVFELLKQERPAFIRWPGGNVAQDYHWTWAIGPRDRRASWANLSWANELENGDIGTDEFVRLCRNLGAEPSITINVEGGGATVSEAAAWVEYANGPATSKQGAVRVANGHPEPFHVKYWEIGNEIWGSWVRGHSDAATYARNYNRYAPAMKAVDPSILLLAVGDNDMKWNQTVLRASGRNIDYLVVHHYYGTAEMRGDPLNLMARPLHYERFYANVREMIRQLVPGRNIRLAINEWNTSMPVPRQHSMESALYGARLMNVFERSDLVAMSAPSDMVNGWSGGLIQASRHGAFVTPMYLATVLYSSHLGTERLASHVESPTFDTTLEGKNVPFLDVVVSRATEAKQIFIKAVNTDPARIMRTTVRFTGTTIAPEALMQTLTADTLTAANS
ncbi:MAG: hypothetical protein JOY79_01145, partial [Acidobacteriaceae bacterium]|nr:hypothetical protein [Acidobacteriaceae bacterium]